MRMRASLFALAILAAAFVAGSPARASGVPRGIHVATGTDGSAAATVTWFTDGLTSPGTTLEYGPTPELGASASGTSQKAPGVNVLVHEVALTGLWPAGTVYYRVGGTGEVRAFRTAPTGRAPFSFTSFADIGTSGAARRVIQEMRAVSPDLALIAGDLSYANGNQPVWDTWFDVLEPLASETPVMAAPGNHELEANSGIGAFRTRFAYPDAEAYYSFDFGNVHFLMLTSDRTTNATEAVLGPMLAFAEADLAEAAKRRLDGEIDFIVVVQHHPLYGNMSAGAADGAVERQMNPFLISWEEPLLHRYDVDLLIAGHNHHFERSTPMIYGRPTTTEKRDYVDALGFIQVISGGGGAGLYSFRDPNDFAPWSAAHARCHHFMRFEVAGKTLRGEAISAEDNCYIGLTAYPAGSVLDAFTLRRT